MQRNLKELNKSLLGISSSFIPCLIAAKSIKSKAASTFISLQTDAFTISSILSFMIYFNYNLSTAYIYLVFMIYYWADMFCVNVWCPFHKLFFKSKCCNECRIYNWDHVMFCTPFLLIKSL